MGIVRRQSIQSSILIYIGFLIGAFNMLVLFPHFFSKEEVGLTRVVLDVQILMASFCSLGSITVIVKFFPYYHANVKPGQNDLPFLAGICCLLGYILFVLLGLWSNDYIIQKFGTRSPLFRDYYFLIFPATFFYLVYNWLEAFAWGYKKTVLTTFMKETFIRILTLILIGLYILKWLDFKVFMILFSMVYALPCCIIGLILLRTTDWGIQTRISTYTKRLKNVLIKFLLPAFGTGLLFFLSRTSDTLFLTGMNGLGDAAIFTIASYIMSTMEVPYRSMLAISAPILSESWKKGDTKNILHIYSQSALNLLIAGVLIFGLIWVNLRNIAAFLPPQYAVVDQLILVLSITKLIDLGTGLNAYVIALSKYRMMEFYSNVFFSAIALPLNYVFIKNYGMMGAAYSGMISLVLYNLVRYLFIWKKLGLQPFSLKNLYALLVGMVSILLVFWIPRMENIYFDGMLRVGLFLVIYLGLILKFEISKDINQLVLGNFNKLKARYLSK